MYSGIAPSRCSYYRPGAKVTRCNGVRRTANSFKLNFFIYNYLSICLLSMGRGHQAEMEMLPSVQLLTAPCIPNRIDRKLQTPMRKRRQQPIGESK